MQRSTTVALAAALTLSVLSGPAAASKHGETADILDQGPGSVLVEDGATLIRRPNSLSIRIAMPTPAPGSYTYPTAGVFSGPGHPEGFSLWAFRLQLPPALHRPL